MKNKSKRTTRGNGFYVQIIAAVFVAILSIYIGALLPAITESRIEECNELIPVLTQELEEAEASKASKKVIEEKRTEIDKYETRLEMLGERDISYSISMIFLVCVLIFGAVISQIKTASFPKDLSYTSNIEYVKYYPMFSAPFAATVMLLAIGVTYQGVIFYRISDLVFLILAVLVGAAVFILYRHIPYLSSKLAQRRLFKSAERKWIKSFSWDDLLFVIPAVLIVILLCSVVFFGCTINGAKLWLKIFGITVQPSEFVKVLAIIMCANSYGKMWRAIFSTVICCFTILAFLYLKDMGAAIIIFAMIMVMLFLMLDNKKTFSLIDNKKLVIIVMLLSICFFALALSMFDYAGERFANTGSAMEKGGQQAQIIKAMIYGGLDGLGVEKSSHIINIFAVDSDMAIAGITAVFGIGMLAIVMLCYAVIIVIPIRRYAVYKSFYFLSAQVSVTILVQVLLNALGAIDVLPFTGIVAPFLSSGGSALVSFCAMIGLVLATLHPVVKPLEVNKP